MVFGFYCKNRYGNVNSRPQKTFIFPFTQLNSIKNWSKSINLFVRTCIAQLNSAERQCKNYTLFHFDNGT